MDLPTLLWNHKLENGRTLSEFVEGNAPSRLPIADLASLREIWNNRLFDAQERKHKDLEARANSILQFLSNNSQGVCMLLWPKYKLSVLFSEHSQAFVLIN